MKAIEAYNLTRDYNDIRAVDQISFTVESGEIYVLLGPNGAGKTTMIKMLIGLLRPTAGCARVAGWDVVGQRDELHTHIGVVFERQTIYERLTARENLLFAARLYGVDTLRVDQVLQKVGVVGQANEKTKKYSNGMKKRLLIARALLPNPDVIFLDEPTTGLDPMMISDVHTILLEVAQQGVTIFLTTHDMDEADRLNDRVAILERGKILAQDSFSQLKAQYGDPGATLDDVFIALTGKDL